MRRLVPVLWSLGVCFGAMDGHAASISWVATDSFVADATTGSIPFKNGSIDITIGPGAGLFTGGVLSPTPFATTSAQYGNIDVEPYSSLNIQPDPAGPALAWSVEFDFSGVSLALGDVFNVGQMFVEPNGTIVTELTISMFGQDGVSPFDLNLLDFEAHARAAANFDAPLIWNPTTGLLTVDSSGAGQNSQYAFFSPASGEIGRIVVSATTTRGGDLTQFAFAVPEPSTLSLLLLGLVGLTQSRHWRR